MDTIRDAAGRTVREGDTVGGTTSGRYQATVIGPVIRIGRGQVKILVTNGPASDIVRPAQGDEKWISADRIFLVASRAEGLPSDGDWSPHDETAVRARAAETSSVRYPDHLVAALLVRVARHGTRR
ncbi:hypothetical protein ACWD3I_24985 [Streptomyces sp. NPDC002817]|uniref:hypothetical protein n=1 Tax=Streptomyces sp. NPDC088357 TaxID=3154655 RepID=UPI00341D2A42